MTATKQTGQRFIFPESFGYKGKIAASPRPSLERADEFEDAESIKLLAALVKAVDARPPADPARCFRRERATDLRCEFTFPAIVQLCVAAGAFPWLMNGKWVGDGDARQFEQFQRCKSSLGRILSIKNSGRSFQLDDGRVVRLTHRGRLRHRRYRIEVVVT